MGIAASLPKPKINSQNSGCSLLGSNGYCRVRIDIESDWVMVEDQRHGGGATDPVLRSSRSADRVLRSSRLTSVGVESCVWRWILASVGVSFGCVCVCVYFGEAGGWLSAVGCERGRLQVVGEWPCTWIGCRQWAINAAVLRVLLLMCYLCVFL